MVCVSWNDTVAFCTWLSGKEGRKYHLPSETEWEYCCRAKNTTRFCCGDDENGNVWEWCADWYDKDYYENNPKQDPPGPSAGVGRVIRGGSWNNLPTYCRSTSRSLFHFGSSDTLGFRIVLLPEKRVAKADATPEKSPSLPDTNKPDAPPVTGVAGDDKGFVPLFNGKDLTGWKTHPKQPGNWRVVKDANGNVLTGSGPTLSHLYTERGDYKNFRLHVEARINDGGLGGVYFRAPFGLVFPAEKPAWPLGYQAKINSTHPDRRKTGSLTIVVNAKSVIWDIIRESPVPHGRWLKMDVIAEENHLVIEVDGKTMKDYTDDKSLFTSGHIALQFDSADTVVEFRKIEIKELPQTKP